MKKRAEQGIPITDKRVTDYLIRLIEKAGKEIKNNPINLNLADFGRRTNTWILPT